MEAVNPDMFSSKIFQHSLTNFIAENRPIFIGEAGTSYFQVNAVKLVKIMQNSFLLYSNQC